ncbi:MAG TPA: hypothetical protein VD862_03530, partial [Candidatus Paceibacterota bacterium]|nr:hypothetical protein [Candidatus Paceibacterota bacterium]
MSVAFTALFAFVSVVAPAHADSPQILSFQGRITDEDGDLLGGSGTNYFFRFEIYDSATGGTELWESHTSSGTTAKVTQGVFNVLLGDSSLSNMASLTSGIFNDPSTYLRVFVSSLSATGPFEEMLPRQRLAAVPYAIEPEGVASDSLDFDEFVDAMTLDANTVVSLNGFTYTMGGLSLRGTNASQSGAFEVSGYASASAVFGAGLTDCDSSGSKLLWDASTGRFSCGTDSGGTFLGLDFGTIGGTLAKITSLSFDDGHFNLSNTASLGFVRLDWGAGGPASLSQDETVTGNWEFRNGASFSGAVTFNTGRLVTSNSLDFDEFVNNMTLDANWRVSSASGAFTITQWPRWATHLIPAADDTYDLGTTALRWRDQYIAPGSLHIGVDGDEASISYDPTLDRLYIALFEGGSSVSSFTLYDTGNASLSGGLEIGGDFVPSQNGVFSLGLNPLQWRNIFSNNASITQNFEVTGVASISNITVNNITIAGDTNLSLASISENLEVSGFASASQFFGAGLVNCNGATSKLLYASASGTFSCGTDLQGSGGASVGLREGFAGAFTNKSSISFDAAHFVLNLANPDARLALDWGAGGPASLSQNETVTGNWTFSGTTNFTASAQFTTLEANTASVSA